MWVIADKENGDRQTEREMERKTWKHDSRNKANGEKWGKGKKEID